MDTYEEEVLKSLLGYQLYKAFIAGIAEVTPAQKWIDLRDGVEFTFEVNGNTVTEKWEGLINTQKISLISYYVYYQYRQFNDSFYSGAGSQVEPLTEHSNRSNNMAIMSSSWNSMVELYGNVYIYCLENINYSFNTYGLRANWRDLDTYNHYNDFASAYNFLLANVTDYPEWVFKPKSNINQLGI